MDAPNEFQPLMDDIFREKVLRARAEKVPGVLSLEGLAMFEDELVSMRESVRTQLPNASEEEVEAEIQRRLEVERRLNEEGFYRTVE